MVCLNEGSVHTHMERLLDKTNRINLLLDFYHGLLTEKQQTFMKLYYQDNYSLGEIAEQFSISRQAINDHIKRAEMLLEDYEDKLHLMTQHEQRMAYLTQLQQVMAGWTDDERREVEQLIEQLINIG